MSRVRILNGEFDPVTLAETIAWAKEWIESGERGYICTVNVAILMLMRSNPALQRFVEGASLVVADGQPLIWASRLGGERLPERVTGVDLVDELCRLASVEGFRVYFLGARPDVIESTTKRLQEKHPDLKVCGVSDGYFDLGDASEKARAIRESGAQILLVGMGVPRQEDFLDECWSELGVNLAVPVGGSFEVVAGTARRAPRFLQRIGMEWFFRLCQEPRRLWKRYLVTNTQFIFHLLRSPPRSGSQAN